MPEKISIRPEMGVLGALQHLSYKPWFALAEFIDNSVQSYIENRHALEALHGTDFVLRVDVESDCSDATARIVIRDNAGGIRLADYGRAFRLASIPPNRKGLSEFGMGMKTAACWFCDRWQLRSTALSEPFEGTVTFDVRSILERGIEDIDVHRVPVPANSHYTELTLDSLRQPIVGGRTIAKVKEYLASIYRDFLRQGKLVLRYNGEEIKFVEREALRAPFHATPAGDDIEWRKTIDIELKDGVRVHGFAALLATGSASRAGFALMRRSRLIQGGADEAWRPSRIFGASNSFVYQRLFGELTLDGVAVSHTKDSFALEAIEDELLPLLRSAINDADLPLITQANNYRVNASKSPERADIAVSAATKTVDNLSTLISEESPIDVDSSEVIVETASKGDGLAPTSANSIVRRSESREFSVDGELWRVLIELTTDAAIGEWITVHESTEPGVREVTLKFSMAHPFVERFALPDSSDLEPLIRMACAIGIAEVLARKAGVNLAGTVRRNINRLLREVMASD
jgi:hypothetical protein